MSVSGASRRHRPPRHLCPPLLRRREAFDSNRASAEEPDSAPAGTEGVLLTRGRGDILEVAQG